MFALGAQAMICALLHESVASLPRENRRISPAAVWFLMIPGFNLLWNFIVLPRVAAACARQFCPASAGTTQALGVLAAVGTVLAAASLCLLAFNAVPAAWFTRVAVSSSTAGLILLVAYLVKLNRLKNL